MTLSEKRAKNVVEALKAKGIAADRIITSYKGDTVQLIRNRKKRSCLYLYSKNDVYIKKILFLKKIFPILMRSVCSPTFFFPYLYENLRVRALGNICLRKSVFPQ